MDLLFPLMAMVLLTFVVCFALGAARLIAIRKRMVNPKFFKVMDGYEEPAWLRQISRNYSNLFELPVLFYALVITALTLNIQNPNLTLFAWVFVVLRVVHTGIHVSYNNPLHRLMIFGLSSVVLLVMWVVLLAEFLS